MSYLPIVWPAVNTSSVPDTAGTGDGDMSDVSPVTSQVTSEAGPISQVRPSPGPQQTCGRNEPKSYLVPHSVPRPPGSWGSKSGHNQEKGMKNVEGSRLPLLVSLSIPSTNSYLSESQGKLHPLSGPASIHRSHLHWTSRLCAGPVLCKDN